MIVFLRALLPTKVFAKAGLGSGISAMCKQQQRLGLEAQCSDLVHILNAVKF
jgi:hypothetical protein